jgi:flagellar assembly factor FliW
MASTDRALVGRRTICAFEKKKKLLLWGPAGWGRCKPRLALSSSQATKETTGMLATCPFYLLSPYRILFLTHSHTIQLLQQRQHQHQQQYAQYCLRLSQEEIVEFSTINREVVKSFSVLCDFDSTLSFYKCYNRVGLALAAPRRKAVSTQMRRRKAVANKCEVVN